MVFSSTRSTPGGTSSKLPKNEFAESSRTLLAFYSLSRRYRRRALVLLFIALQIVGFPRSANGQGIGQFQHTIWSTREGAPGGMGDFDQTTDGFLWIATKTGLYRFDGVRFDKYPFAQEDPLPSNNIYAVFAASGGGLWICYNFGGASFLKDGKLTNFPAGVSLPTSPIIGLVERTSGSFWTLLADGSVLYLDGSRWTALGKDWDVPSGANSLIADGTGTLWVAVSNKMFVLASGGRKFLPIKTRGPGVLLVTPDLAVTLKPNPGPHNGKLSNHAHGPFGARDSVFHATPDHRGGFWWCNKDGIRYSRSLEDPEPQHLLYPDDHADRHRSEGESLPCVAVLQDREGNIWETTRTTLERYRSAAVVPVQLPKNEELFAFGKRDRNGIWVTSSAGTLTEIQDSTIVSQFPVPGTAVSIYRDGPDSLWLGTRPKGRILHFVGNRFREEVRTDADTDTNVAAAITMDHQGRLWALFSGKGLFRFDRGHWVNLASMGAPAHGSVSSFADSAGQMWFGFQRNQVARLIEDKATMLSRNEGVQVGNVTSITGRNGSVWIGGERGLETFDGHRFLPMLPADKQSFVDITGIIPTDGDGLWFGESTGIIHVQDSELRKFQNDANYRVSYRTFGTLDGLPSALQGPFPAPSALQGADGLLWFATSDGIVWIDPKNIPRNPVPPPVVISSITFGGQKASLSPSAALSLPARTTSVQFDYSGLSLSVPERVKFRYQLEGQDKSWQDAGTRRQAFYTNLGPGKYRFHVVACNNDGVWNETGATYAFTIAPAFYQTWWFRLFYLALAAGAFRFLFVYRVRRATAEVQRRLGAQMEERERIARELHDTLLQGFQGLMLRFQAIMNTLSKDQPAHQMMEQVLDRADGVLLEGRQSVRDLREKGSNGTDLAAALSSCGQELALGHSSVFSLTVVGSPRPIEPVVFDESYRIAREALINAFQHSKATKIETEITYNDSGVCIRTRDDGRGIEANIVTQGRHGHWGISGMRERAHKIGAKLDIWSSPGAGTEVELAVPAVVAYSGTNIKTLWQPIKRNSQT